MSAYNAYGAPEHVRRAEARAAVAELLGQIRAAAERLAVIGHDAMMPGAEWNFICDSIIRCQEDGQDALSFRYPKSGGFWWSTGGPAPEKHVSG